MNLLESVQSQLSAQEELRGNLGKIGDKAAWWIILTIILSLAILSSIFFFLWYTKIRQQPLEIENFQMFKTSERRQEPDKMDPKEKKKVDIGDIKRMLKNKQR